MAETDIASLDAVPLRVRPLGPGEWQVGTLIEHRMETAHAATLRFALPQSMTFIAGQFIKLRTAIAGYERPLRRSYSLASAPSTETDCIEITVSRAEPGIVSRYLVDEISPGQTVEIRGPQGALTRPAGNDDASFLIAGGSGIVPLMSMLREQRDTGGAATVTLLYSARTWDDVIYKDELQEMAELPWCNVHFALTRSQSGPSGAHLRRIDTSMLTEVMPSQFDNAYMCGPASLVLQMSAELENLGVDSANIHMEVFD